MPSEGVRVTPTTAAGFAKLVSPNTDAALKGAAGARGFRIIALELTVSSGVTLNYGILRIGEANESSLSLLPGEVTLDRLYVHGNALGNISRCVTLNGMSTAVIDSYLSECHAKGFDSQAIAGWAGPGPFKIVNNYLEGAGENIIFGGADPRISGVTPSDIEIRRNHLFKQLAWLTSKQWTIKNLFELKNAKRVLFEGNVLQNNWADGQSGYGILFQGISDNPAVTWTTVQDVTVRYNWMSTSGSGVTLLGTAHTYETPMARIAFSDNLFTDIGRPELLAEGKLFLILGGTQGIRDLVLNHNTILHSQVAGTARGVSAMLDGFTTARDVDLVLLNNLFSVGGSGGLAGNAVGIGTVALNTYSSPWDFRGNAMANDPDAVKYPAGNFFPSLASLNLDSQFRLGVQLNGTDGRSVGADMTALQAAIAGVAP